MDGEAPGLLMLAGSTRPPMKAPVFLTLAALAAASPLAAQSAPASLAGEAQTDGDFRDLGIVQLVDAADALRDPAFLPPPARHPAPDASCCDADTLIFCEINTLAPGEIFCSPTRVSAEAFKIAILPRAVPGNEPVPAAAPGPPVACADSSNGSVIPAGQPVLAGATPIPADQVPEPSAILLVIGAAAWILLRKKQ